MKTGNSTHAVVLTVVAVGAIGFLVLRLMPPGHRAVKVKEASATTASGKGDVAQLLPTDVTRDAFAHPRLIERYHKADIPPVTPNLPGAVANDGQTNVESGASDNPKGDIGGGGARDSTGKPVKDTGTNRLLKRKPVPVDIQVKAVLRATTPMALITINGKKEQMMGLGDTVGDSYKITGITEDSVHLVNGKKTLVVHVGQSGVAK